MITSDLNDDEFVLIEEKYSTETHSKIRNSSTLSDTDGDGIPYRTIPGVHPKRFTTRGQVTTSSAAAQKIQSTKMCRSTTH